MSENLVPVSQNDDVYQIELLDYIMTSIANLQPQQLLNKLTYYNDYWSNTIDLDEQSLLAVLEAFDDSYDDAEQDIETIKASSDVVDIVGTYAALQNYDTSGLYNNDVIKVIADETHDNACTFYRWNTSSFVYESYERNDIPVTLTSSVTVNPNYDVTYIVTGSNPTITLGNGNYALGGHVTFIALTKCTIAHSGITKVLYAHDTLTLYYKGNNQWSSASPETLSRLFPIGTIVWTNTESIDLGGTWEKIQEGVLLVPDTENIGDVDGQNSHTLSSTAKTSPSHTITLNETPSHSHHISGGTGGVSANHVHSVASYDKPSYSSSTSGSACADVTGTITTSGISHNHYHWVGGTSGGVSGGTSAPGGHTHSVTFNAITFNVQQASYAYYAWKRTA